MAASLGEVVERLWAGDSASQRALGAALRPAAALYGAAVALRNRLYDRGTLASTTVAAHVVSVGNLTVGGTGKTPTALWVAERLAARGRRVAIVARGYGKQRRGVVVVGVDGRTLVDPIEGGDEAALLAARFPGPVVTGERRVAAARAACDRFGVDTIVLDDGFQHRALARDADLVLVPVDPGPLRLLPSGPMREPVGGLRRARAVLALGDETRLPPPPFAPVGVVPFVGRVVPTATVVAADGGLAAHDLGILPRRGVVAVAGVARPERFWALLDRLGVEVGERLRLPDHHRYGAGDVVRLRAATDHGRRVVVTTEKDLVKLARLEGAEGLRAYAIRVAVDVEEGERLVDCLLAPGEVALRPE